MNMVEALAIKCAEGTTMLKLKLNLFRAKIKKIVILVHSPDNSALHFMTSLTLYLTVCHHQSSSGNPALILWQHKCHPANPPDIPVPNSVTSQGCLKTLPFTL